MEVSAGGVPTVPRGTADKEMQTGAKGGGAMTLQDEGQNRVPCPFCKELIPAGAQVCPLCRASLGGAAQGGPAPGAGDASVAVPAPSVAPAPPLASVSAGQTSVPAPAGQPAPKKSKLATIIRVVVSIGCLGLVVLAILAMQVPGFLAARAQAQRKACWSNIKDMSTAMEIYATDNNRHYPASLDELSPDYLKTIPTCPAAGSNTYMLESTTPLAGGGPIPTPDNFTVYCAGNNHVRAGLGENQPSYTPDGFGP